MDKWIPLRDALPETTEWVQVMTQDGTVFPAQYINNKWSPLFRGGLVDHLMHGKVAYWQPHEKGYPYVQCQCGSFYLQAEGRKECPICASFRGKITNEQSAEPKRTRKKEVKVEKEEPVPFSDPLDESLIDEE